jgi:hypothetical protein
MPINGCERVGDGTPCGSAPPQQRGDTASRGYDERGAGPTAAQESQDAATAWRCRPATSS